MPALQQKQNKAARDFAGTWRLLFYEENKSDPTNVSSPLR
jgi:hypothetical protein